MKPYEEFRSFPDISRLREARDENRLNGILTPSIWLYTNFSLSSQANPNSCFEEDFYEV